MDKDNDSEITKQEMADMMDSLCVPRRHPRFALLALNPSPACRGARRENKDRKSKTGDWFKKLGVFALVFDGWVKKDDDSDATPTLSRSVFESFFSGWWPNGEQRIPNDIGMSSVAAGILNLSFRGAA